MRKLCRPVARGGAGSATRAGAHARALREGRSTAGRLALWLPFVSLAGVASGSLRRRACELGLAAGERRASDCANSCVSPSPQSERDAAAGMGGVRASGWVRVPPGRLSGARLCPGGSALQLHVGDGFAATCSPQANAVFSSLGRAVPRRISRLARLAAARKARRSNRGAAVPPVVASSDRQGHVGGRGPPQRSRWCGWRSRRARVCS